MPGTSPKRWRNFVVHKRRPIVGAMLGVLALLGGLIVAAGSRNGTGAGIAGAFWEPLHLLSGSVATYQVNVQVDTGPFTGPHGQQTLYVVPTEYEKLQRLSRETDPIDELLHRP